MCPQGCILLLTLSFDRDFSTEIMVKTPHPVHIHDQQVKIYKNSRLVFTFSHFYRLNVLWSFEAGKPGSSVCLCVCKCVFVSVRASIAKLLGRSHQNLRKCVPWSSCVLLIFSSSAYLMTSRRPCLPYTTRTLPRLQF